MNQELCDKLNALHASPNTAEGKVVSLSNDQNEELADAQLVELGLDPDNLGVVDEHEEGADRGGYVPWLYVNGKQTAFYYVDELWIALANQRQGKWCC